MKTLIDENVGFVDGEYNVLTSPVFEQAFKAVCEKYQPKYKYAVFALCTKQRPYSSSMKWRGIIKIFSGWCDLIVCSNAGIIPLEYEDYYPFNSYNSDGTAAELSDFSKQLFHNRLVTFFNNFKWDKVAFLLNPYEGAAEVVQELQMPNVQQFPSPWVWDNTTDRDFIGYSLKFQKMISKGCIEEVQSFFRVKIPYLDKKFDRKMSLLKVVKDIYENVLVDGVGYTQAELVDIISGYGEYHKTYIYKVIRGNVAGEKDYKFYIKNNEYFQKINNLYYKNTGQPIRVPNKLF